MKRIDEIAARAEKATKGPWEQSHRKIPNDPGSMYATQVYDSAGKTIATLAWYDRPKPDGWRGSSREENADFIANAIMDIPFLLASQKKMREAVEAIANELAFIDEVDLTHAEKKIKRRAEAALKEEGENV
jgi:hypothetical protein